jgi:hypothetical protein
VEISEALKLPDHFVCRVTVGREHFVPALRDLLTIRVAGCFDMLPSAEEAEKGHTTGMGHFAVSAAGPFFLLRICVMAAFELV